MRLVRWVVGLGVAVASGSVGCSASPTLQLAPPLPPSASARTTSEPAPDQGVEPGARMGVCALLDQGRQALAVGQSGRSQALFRKAAALAPEDGEPLVWLGMAARAEHAADSRNLFELGLKRLESATGTRVRAEFPVGFGYWLPAGTGIEDVEWDPSGANLAMVVDQTLWLYETRGFSLVRRWDFGCKTIFDVALGSNHLLAAACADESVRIWDFARASQLHKLAGHAAPVTEVAFSPDGRTLASGSSDKTIRTWDVQTGTALHTFPIGGSVKSLAFSPDGLRLVALVYDLDHSSCPKASDVARGSSVAPSAKAGKPSGFGDTSVCVIDVDSGDISTRQPTARIHLRDSMDSISPVDRWALGDAETVGLWDSHGQSFGAVERDPGLEPSSAQDLPPSAHVGHEGHVYVLAGHHERPTLSRYPPELLVPDHRIPARPWADRFRLEPAEKRVAFWSSYPSRGPVVTRLADGQLVHDFGGQTERFAHLAPQESAGTLVAWSKETRVELDSATGMVTRREPAPFARHPYGAVATDGSRFVGWERRATTVSLYDGATGELVATLPIGPAPTDTMGRLPTASFSGDGRVFAFAGNGHVRWYDARQGTSLGVVRGYASGLALDGTGRLLAVAGLGDVMVRPIRSQQRGCRLARDNQMIQALTFGVGPRLATLAYDGVRLFDPTTCAQLHPAIDDGLTGGATLAFSNDGRWLAYSSSDQVSVLDTFSWQLEARFRGQGPNFGALAFAPGGRLYGLTWDGTLHVWSLQTRKLALIQVVEGSRDSYVFTLDDPPRFELLGDGGRSHGTCGVGSFHVPLDACEHRFATRGLLADVLGKR